MVMYSQPRPEDQTDNVELLTWEAEGGSVALDKEEDDDSTDSNSLNS